MQKSTFTSEYRALIQILRQERQKQGITQKDLAQRLGVTQGYVSKCEQGERRIDVVELAWFCKALGISIHKLIKKLSISTNEGGD